MLPTMLPAVSRVVDLRLHAQRVHPQWVDRRDQGRAPPTGGWVCTKRDEDGVIDRLPPVQDQVLVCLMEAPGGSSSMRKSVSAGVQSRAPPGTARSWSSRSLPRRQMGSRCAAICGTRAKMSSWGGRVISREDLLRARCVWCSQLLLLFLRVRTEESVLPPDG